MADSAVAEDAVEAAAKPSGSRRRRRLILFIAAPLVLLMVVGAAVYFTGLGSLVGLGAPAQQGAKSGADGVPAFFDLPDMLVNINAGSRRQGFLKLSVTLEVASADMVPHIREVLPRVIDNFQTYLRELRVEDLAGSAGLYRLREELLVRVNAAIAPARVTDVLFKEMLVQQ